MDVFRERWAYFSGVSLKRCDETADRVQGKDATRGRIEIGSYELAWYQQQWKEKQGYQLTYNS